MTDRYDVVILGAGPAGEVAANTLNRAGRRVALIEPELIGGECSNWGCIPSKTLLRAPDLKGQGGRAAGVAEPGLDFAEIAAYRDYMVSYHDDSGKVARLEETGVTVIKAPGRLAGPGRADAGGRLLETDAVILATGAEAVIPPLPGLAEVGYWTNREATSASEVPASIVFIGGGVVSIELAQLYARFGSRVTIVQGPPRLAEREAPEISAELASILVADGVELRLGRLAASVRRDGDERVVTLDDGSEARGAELVVAVGRRPRTRDIGLETVGLDRVEVDARCRVAPGIWAAGDVTAVAMFTHVGKYQARIAAADILGMGTDADYRAVPRVVFTDPEVAAVGLTEEQAREQGIHAASAAVDLTRSIARPYTFERDPHGTFGVVVDLDRDVLVGAWALAPLASEWIHMAVLAIRAEVPVPVLKDTIAQFPSFSEAFGAALRALPVTAHEHAADHAAHPMIEPEPMAAAR